MAGVTGSQRGVLEIAMSAACSGLVAIYQSFPGEPSRLVLRLRDQ